MSEMYYSLDKIDKMDKLFNWIITARGTGKTIAIKRKMVDIAKNGKRFVYIRRRKKECESNQLTNFFDKMQAIGYHNDVVLKYDSEKFFMNEKIAGYVTALSTSVNVRSIDFLDVTDIFFEEFILEEDENHHYLKNEVERFLELYVTISRNTDTRVWFIGNNIELFNPYFLYFNIYPNEIGIKTWKDHAIEFYRNPIFEKTVEKTRFGQLIKDTPYSDYSIKNASLTAQSQFIKRMPKGVRPIFNIIYNNGSYGVYAGRGCMCYVTDYKSESKNDVSFSDKDNSVKNITYKMFKSMYECDLYINALKRNNLYYTSEKSQTVGRIINRLLYFI